MQRQINRRLALGQPPQFVPTWVAKRKLRFQAGAAATQASPTLLYVESFADLLCVAATATSAYRLASHVRLNKIEMWGPMASDLVPVTVTLDWTGSTTSGGFGKSNRVSDTSMGASECAHLVARPPPNAQISQWMAAKSVPSNEVCRLSYPAKTIIDVTYEVVVIDDGTSASVVAAVAGATVGANYVRSLDSLSGTNLVPIALSTI